MIGDDEWLFCLASITQTKCNHQVMRLCPSVWCNGPRDYQHNYL